MSALPITDDEVLVIVRDVLTGARIEAADLRRAREKHLENGGPCMGLGAAYIDGFHLALEYLRRNGLNWASGVGQLRMVTWSSALKRLANAGHLKRINLASEGLTRYRQPIQPRWVYALPDAPDEPATEGTLW
jgi:hypothetical protein